jgi:hypothetical protein
MIAGIPDIHQILEYRTDTSFRRLLPIALGLCVLAVILWALDKGRSAETAVVTGLIMAAGIGLAGIALWRRSHPEKPRFALSPLGIRVRFPDRKEVLVPWREIQGVDTVDIKARGDIAPFRDVTVVLVSKQFYEAHVSVDPKRLGWDTLVVPKGPLVQIALHHQLLSVEPQVLREAVETRWHAFRDGQAISDDPHD